MRLRKNLLNLQRKILSDSVEKKTVRQQKNKFSGSVKKKLSEIVKKTW